MDGYEDGDKFSLIASEIHDWRNVLAHQWLSVNGYRFGYDYVMTKGWRREEGIIYINPQIYAQVYLNLFSLNGKMWEYRNQFSFDELMAINNRIIEKFIR